MSGETPRGYALGSKMERSKLGRVLHIAELRPHWRGLVALSSWWLVACMYSGAEWDAISLDLLQIAFGEGLIVLAVFDFYYGYLYDSWEALLGVIALITATAGEWGLPAALSCALSAGGFMCLVRLFSRGGLGLGDVKLAAVIGLYLGYSDTVLALFIAFFGGGLVASFLLVTRRARARSRLPFGPFLAMGALLAMVVGDALWQLYEALLC